MVVTERMMVRMNTQNETQHTKYLSSSPDAAAATSNSILYSFGCDIRRPKPIQVLGHAGPVSAAPMHVNDDSLLVGGCS